MNPPADGPIGASVTRREDARVLWGETQYIDDLEPPGTAHVAFVRSPYAHARITGITPPGETGGLLAVLTGDDLRGTVRTFPITHPEGAEVLDSEAHPVLAGEEVRYAGQAVAMVIAQSRALAEDVVERVEVEYEPLETVTAARESDLISMTWERRTGDVDGAFAAADHVISGTYSLPRLAAAPMETRGCVAVYDAADDALTVWVSAQDTHRPMAQLAHILDRPTESLRVIVPDVGGAFGSKGVIAPEVAAVAAAAIRLRVPVKWTEDRLENLVAAYQGRGIEGDLALALDSDGRMLGLRARLWADLGGYLLTTTAIPPHTAATLITGCYDIATADVRVLGARTHKPPTGPYRGAGRPDAAYMLESLVDRAAAELGIDRSTLRRRNLIRQFPHRNPQGLEYDSGDFEKCLDVALELSAAPLSAGGAEDAATGTGIAVYVERAGGAWESAEIALGPGGGFVVASSASPHGQGHDTTFAQIAAQYLQVQPDAVQLRFSDSATVPAGVGTFGSRSVAMAGSAIAVAAEKLVTSARGLAAELLGTDAATVTLTGRGFTQPGSPETLSWARLAAAGIPLRATARFASANVFSSGAYAADVEIDRGTGRLTVRRLVAVDDAGTLINPLLVHGQVIGGAVQGLGECLVEAVLHNEEGQMSNASFLDYSLLTAAEIPPILTGEVQTPSPLNPLGAKGAGEGGAIGSLAAVANAVTDALGGRHVDPPFTAEKLWRALQDGRP